MSWVVEALPKTNLCVRMRVRGFCCEAGEEEDANQGGLSIREGGSSGMDVRSLFTVWPWPPSAVHSVAKWRSCCPTSEGFSGGEPHGLGQQHSGV